MIKQKTVLEVKIGERVYELFCQSDSPLGELHDALLQMKGFTVEKMVIAHRQEQEAAEAQKQIDEEVSDGE
jgi:hypothetical protein